MGLAPPPVRENSLLFFFYLNPSLRDKIKTSLPVNIVRSCLAVAWLLHIFIGYIGVPCPNRYCLPTVIKISAQHWAFHLGFHGLINMMYVSEPILNKLLCTVPDVISHTQFIMYLLAFCQSSTHIGPGVNIMSPPSTTM